MTRRATIWELLPEEAKRLPAKLAKSHAYLDDERFVAPWRALFDRRLGRCREVSDSISWRRFRRPPLDRPVPHPTTLASWCAAPGAEVIDQLNQVLLAKLVGDKLLRARKLRVDTTVVEADIDHPTDADLAARGWRLERGMSDNAKSSARRRSSRPSLPLAPP